MSPFTATAHTTSSINATAARKLRPGNRRALGRTPLFRKDNKSATTARPALCTLRKEGKRQRLKDRQAGSPRVEPRDRTWAIHAGGCYSVLRSQEADPCHNVDGPRGHRAQGNAPGTEGQGLIPFVRGARRVRSTEMEQRVGAGGWGSGMYSGHSFGRGGWSVGMLVT